MLQMNRFLMGVISFLVIAGLATSRTPAASATDIYIPALEGSPGQTITVPVMISQVDNLAGLKMVIKYDPRILTFKKGQKTKQSNSLMHIINDKKPGRLILVMAGARGIKGRDFAIMNLTFKIKGKPKGKQTTTIGISDVEMMSDQLKQIACRARAEQLIISPEVEICSPEEQGNK